MEEKRAHLLIVTKAGAESRLLQNYLQDDYALALAEAGETALRQLEASTDIDMVILSGAPVDMSAVALVRAIRGKYPAATLPLIVLADDGDPDEVALAFQLGADNCLTRPFTEAALKARVEALLALKRSYDRARAERAELAQSDLQRLQVSRMASHDLQSPLSNIRLAVKELERAAEGDRTEVNHALQIIRRMAERIEDIMSSYLDVMELNSGRLEYKLKPVSLRDVIVNVVSQYELAARKKDMALAVVSTDGWVMADAERVVQALGNLVSNAIKYSPLGSQVRIATSVKPDYARITVADQGPGISPAERSSLFQEFGKLSTYPTGGESRTGLGLWIVKQLVEAQQGFVDAEFPETGGSIFSIALPTAAPFSADDAE